MTPDAVSGWARGVLRFFMVQYPTRTSLGIAGGVIVATAVDTLKPYLSSINVAAITDFRLAVCGVFVANVGLLFKKGNLPEDIEQEFAGIRRAITEGNLSQAHQKLLYQKLAQNIIERATLSRKLAEGVSQIESELAKEQHGGSEVRTRPAARR